MELAEFKFHAPLSLPQVRDEVAQEIRTMLDMKELKANISFSLTAMCPHCGVEMDLMDPEDCAESAAPGWAFWAFEAISDWFGGHGPRGRVATCGFCDGEFKLTEIEW